MNFLNRRPVSIFICFVSAWILAVASALLVTHWQLAGRVDEQLNRVLPAAVESGLQSRINQPGEVEQLIKRINSDLQSLPLKQQVKTVQILWVQLDTLGSELPSTPINSIRWKTGDQQRIMGYHWGYKIHWFALMLAAFAFALVLTAVYILFPQPISPERRRWLAWLRRQGKSRAQAKSLTADLTQPLSNATHIWLTHLVDHLPFADALVWARAAAEAKIPIEQLPWLLLGWKLDTASTSKSPASAIAIASAPLGLEFDLAQQKLHLHGITINISQTPLFYYLWYALQRQAGDGWVLNPSSQHADTVMSKSLITLMRDYNGHPKAIAELDEQGLRAKTLDQNRSKIKDAICSVLGEELAAQFLFESEKDKRTGRSRYRLVQALSVSIQAQSANLIDEPKLAATDSQFPIENPH